MPSEMTMTRLMIYEIRERNPRAVGFRVDQKAVQMVAFNLKLHRYKSIIALFGKDFLLEVMKMYEEAERYEDCQKMIDQLKEYESYNYD